MFVLWEQEDHTGVFDLQFLLDHCMAKESLQSKRDLMKPTPSKKVNIIINHKYDTG